MDRVHQHLRDVGQVYTDTGKQDNGCPSHEVHLFDSIPHSCHYVLYHPHSLTASPHGEVNIYKEDLVHVES